MTQSQDAVISRIRTLVTETPNYTITGSRLTALLRHSFPDFSPLQYGTKNLRAFIRQNLAAEIEEIGKVGMDVVYGLPATEGSPQRLAQHDMVARSVSNDSKVISPEAFRIFKSPNSPFELHANRDSGEVRIASAGSIIGQPWAKIQSASPEMLSQIAKEFAVQLTDESHRSFVASSIEQSPNAWWQKVWPYLQKNGLSGQWGAFKNRRLRTILQEQLSNLGISAPDDSFTVTSRPIGAPFKQHNESERQFDPASVKSQVDETAHFRSIVIKALQNLSLGELRSLNLPAGELFDAIMGTPRR